MKGKVNDVIDLTAVSDASDVVRGDATDTIPTLDELLADKLREDARKRARDAELPPRVDDHQWFVASGAGVEGGDDDVDEGEGEGDDDDDDDDMLRPEDVYLQVEMPAMTKGDKKINSHACHVLQKRCIERANTVARRLRRATGGGPYIGFAVLADSLSAEEQAIAATEHALLKRCMAREGLDMRWSCLFRGDSSRVCRALRYFAQHVPKSGGGN